MFVAVTDGRPVGFVAVALNAFHEGMGVIDIIGVDLRLSAAGDQLPADRVRDRAHAAVAWTSPSWRRAATRDTNRRGGVPGSWVHAPAHRLYFRLLD